MVRMFGSGPAAIIDIDSIFHLQFGSVLFETEQDSLTDAIKLMLSSFVHPSPHLSYWSAAEVLEV